MRGVYKWWATLVFAAVIVQIGLAGYGAFYVVGKTDNGGVANDDTISNGFDLHVAWGYLGVGLSMLIFLVIGVIAGVGKWRLVPHGPLFALWFLQVVLAIGAYETPYVGFFHQRAGDLRPLRDDGAQRLAARSRDRCAYIALRPTPDGCDWRRRCRTAWSRLRMQDAS